MRIVHISFFFLPYKCLKIYLSSGRFLVQSFFFGFFDAIYRFITIYKVVFRCLGSKWVEKRVFWVEKPLALIFHLKCYFDVFSRKKYFEIQLVPQYQTAINLKPLNKFLKHQPKPYNKPQDFHSDHKSITNAKVLLYKWPNRL